MTPNPQAATVRALKTMWRKRWDEAEQQAEAIGVAAVMSGEWGDALSRLVTLRAEMQEIGQAIGWAEDGASWAVVAMSAPLQTEHAALMATPEKASLSPAPS